MRPAIERCWRSVATSYLRGVSLRSDQKALLFIGAVAVLGAGVRVVRASRPDLGDQPALQQQSRAADSAARAGRPTGKRTARKPSEAKRRSPEGGAAAPSFGSGPLDRPGYVAGKLDLDIATAAQIDSLPSVGPAMAKRIVADRMRRGPFGSLAGLRRVKGVGPSLLAKIDALVMFSGTIRPADSRDTVIAKRR